MPVLIITVIVVTVFVKYSHASAKCGLLVEQPLSLFLTVVGASLVCKIEMFFVYVQWCCSSTRYIIAKECESCL